jgi:hypothetical protein
LCFLGSRACFRVPWRCCCLLWPTFSLFLLGVVRPTGDDLLALKAGSRTSCRMPPPTDVAYPMLKTPLTSAKFNFMHIEINNQYLLCRSNPIWASALLLQSSMSCPAWPNCLHILMSIRFRFMVDSLRQAGRRPASHLRPSFLVPLSPFRNPVSSKLSSQSFDFFLTSFRVFHPLFSSRLLSSGFSHPSSPSLQDFAPVGLTAQIPSSPFSI